MIKHTIVQQVCEQFESITCDVCKTTYYRRDHPLYNQDSAFEMQEFLCFKNEGGYGSVFGDGTKVTLDICQHCLKKLFGQYIIIHDEDKD